MEKQIAIGKFTKAHGIKGQVIFISYSGEFDKSHYPDYFIKNSSGELVTLDILNVKPYPKYKTGFFMTLKDFDTNRIERELLQKEVFVEGLNYESLKEDEFFYRDFINYQVFFNQEFFGKVLSVHNFGAGDLLEVEVEIQPTKDGKSKTKTHFLPFKMEFIESIDESNKKIIFNNLEWRDVLES